jgi:histone H3/H4
MSSQSKTSNQQPQDGGRKVSSSSSKDKTDVHYMKASRIKWLASKGGVVTLSEDVVPQVRGMVEAELARIVEKAVAECGFNRRRMVSVDDVAATFKKLNIKYDINNRENNYEVCKSFKLVNDNPAPASAKVAAGGNSSVMNRASPRSIRAMDSIEYYKNQEDCFILHRKPFALRIKDMSKVHSDLVRWTSGASAVLQAYVEGWVTKLFTHSVASAKYRNANRVTIKVADVDQGRLILGPN